jgi:hypothetical protein
MNPKKFSVVYSDVRNQQVGGSIPLAGSNAPLAAR